MKIIWQDNGNPSSAMITRDKGLIKKISSPKTRTSLLDNYEVLLKIIALSLELRAVSAFIIICSAHVHWFALQLKLISIQPVAVLMMRRYPC